MNAPDTAPLLSNLDRRSSHDIEQMFDDFPQGSTSQLAARIVAGAGDPAPRS